MGRETTITQPTQGELAELIKQADAAIAEYEARRRWARRQLDHARDQIRYYRDAKRNLKAQLASC